MYSSQDDIEVGRAMRGDEGTKLGLELAVWVDNGIGDGDGDGDSNAKLDGLGDCGCGCGCGCDCGLELGEV